MAASKNLETTGLQFEHQRPSDSLVRRLSEPVVKFRDVELNSRRHFSRVTNGFFGGKDEQSGREIARIQDQAARVH